MLGMNSFDVILSLLLIVSIIGGFIKGFTTEVLKIVAWAGAILLTIIAIPLSTTFMMDYIASEQIAKIAGIGLTFLVSFLFLKFLAKFVGERIRTSFVAPIDRGLGAVFGLARGILIFSAVYLMYTNVAAREKWPDWLTEARLYPALTTGAEILEAITPDLFEKAEEVSKKVLDADTDAILADMKDNMPSTTEVVDYTLEQREEIEDLIGDVASGEDDEG